MNKKVTKVYVFDNGNIAVFDDKDNQIPELQINLLTWMKKQGYDVLCKKMNV